MANLDERCRRAHYRATHRGTKEMDWLLGRYATAEVFGMSEPELAAFEALLAMPDPQLHQWIALGSATGAPEIVPLIAAIRRFHGLEPAP